jgi:signal transduction histidine kinase
MSKHSAGSRQCVRAPEVDVRGARAENHTAGGYPFVPAIGERLDAAFRSSTGFAMRGGSKLPPVPDLPALTEAGMDAGLPGLGTAAQALLRTQPDIDTLWRQLEVPGIDALGGLPRMRSSAIRLALDALAKELEQALWLDGERLLPLGARIVAASLGHGDNDALAIGCLALGVASHRLQGRSQYALPLAQCALSLAERHDCVRVRSLVKLHFARLVLPWHQSLRDARPLLDCALDMTIGGAPGALPAPALARLVLLDQMMAGGETLPRIEDEAEHALRLLRVAGDGPVAEVIASRLRLVRTLGGATPLFGSLDDAGFDEHRFEASLRHPAQCGAPCALSARAYWLHKLQARYFSGAYAEALQAAAAAQPLLQTQPRDIDTAEHAFYCGMTHAASHAHAPAQESEAHLRALDASCRQLDAWAADCPANFAAMAALLAAEACRLRQDAAGAMRHYEQALASAVDHGQLQYEALTHERTACFYRQTGFTTIAYACRDRAHRAYLQWGALGKAKQLEMEHAALREAPLGTLTPAPGASAPETLDRFDLQAVLQASQALSGEIDIERLIETLMPLALRLSGAEYGMLLLSRKGKHYLAARAWAQGEEAAEVRLEALEPGTPHSPRGLLKAVMRERRSMVQDATQHPDCQAAAGAGNASPDDSGNAGGNRDASFSGRGPRSTLGIPLLKKNELIGLLYLDKPCSGTPFTAARVSVLDLLATQAAISLDHARLYQQLERENEQRRRAEQALSASRTTLAMGQQLSHTGSWRWNIDTGELAYSDEMLRILGIDPVAGRGTFAELIERVDREDRVQFTRELQQALHDGQWLQQEYRVRLPDGTVRHLESVGRRESLPDGSLSFFSTAMDVSKRKDADEALRLAHAELARVARITTMGEFAASIAHEVNQPLAAIVLNARAALHWLKHEEPNVGQAREALQMIVSAGTGAGDVIRSMRSLARKSGPEMAVFSVDDAIREVLLLLRAELHKHGIRVNTQLGLGERAVRADRAQLQQVVMNLVMNAIEAMSGVTERERAIGVISAVEPCGTLRLSVEDNGSGFDAQAAERMFDALFSTKPNGMGMGLSICRSIVETHGGKLWARPRKPHGAAFYLTLPQQRPA